MKKWQVWKILKCWTKTVVATGLRGNSFWGINEQSVDSRQEMIEKKFKEK